MRILNTPRTLFLFLILLCFTGYDVRSQCTIDLLPEPSHCVASGLSFGNYTLQAFDTGCSNNATLWTCIYANGQDTIRTTVPNSQFSATIPICGKVILIAEDTSCGCIAVDSSIVADCKPVLRGHLTTDVTCVGNCIRWIDSSLAGISPGYPPGTGPGTCGPLSYSINWGHGGNIPYPDSCYQYAADGQYNFTIIITNQCGCEADTTMDTVITVTGSPPATFTGTPLTSCAYPMTSTMTFTGTPPQNAKYWWYVSQNTGAGPFTLIQAGPSPTFTYTYGQGTFSIQLMVEDSASLCSSTVTQTNYVVTGTNAAACFTANITQGCVPQTVTYCPCGSFSGVTNFHWLFPGGTPSFYNGSSSGCQTVFYGAPAGCHDVTLIVEYPPPGACLDTLIRSNYVCLGNPYSISFTMSGDTSCVAPFCTEATYTGQSCPACNFIWNPPGYNTGNSHDTAQWCFNSFGQYTPQLTVTDPFGCTESVSQPNVIDIEPLQASVRVDELQNNGCQGDTISLVNTTAGFTVATWSCTNCTVITQSNDSDVVEFTQPGWQKYELIVQNTTGCIDTLKDSVNIGQMPTVTLIDTPNRMCFQYECVNFVATIIGTDTPTTVKVWPEGLSHPGISFIMNRMDSFQNCYLYQDTGTFYVCFLASTQTCHGDTICPGDTIVIYPPIPKFRTVTLCNQRDSQLFINTSVGADSIYWNVNGVQMGSADSLYVAFPTCNTAQSIGLLAVNDSVNLPAGCRVMHLDSTATVPCYGANFVVPPTGCYDNYRETFIILYDTAIHALQATDPHVIWDFEMGLTAPVFNGHYNFGNSDFIGINAPGIWSAYVQLTYPNGCVDTISKLDSISISEPTAYFTVNDSAGCIPLPVQFTDSSYFLIAGQAHYVYNFGDGSPEDSTVPNPSHTFMLIGQFNVTLTVTDSNGCTSSYSRQIQANQIHASISETDTITCTANPSPLNPITFASTSTGIVANYQWILDTAAGGTGPFGTVGNTASITLQFRNQGYDSIGLIATDQFNICRDTAWIHFHVANPIADYTLSNLLDTFAICPPINIDTFYNLSANNICSYAWDFHDGNPIDHSFEPGQIYTLPGFYPVTLIVTSCHGCMDTANIFGIDIAGPHLSMTRTNVDGCPCQPVTFYVQTYDADSFTITSDNATVLYYYNLPITPRGTFLNPTVDTVTFTYCDTGAHNPSVVAVDNTNHCHVQFLNLVAPVIIDSPMVAFSFTRSGCGTDSACFTNLTRFESSSAYDSTILWNFGDGTTDNTNNPCHHFPAPGNYLVTLTIMDNVGCLKSLTQNVYFGRTPFVSFTMNDSTGCAPAIVLFTDSVVVDDSTYISPVSAWTFGDGGTAFLDTIFDTVSHDYVIPNIGNSVYTVMLVVVDGYGCTDTATHTVQIQPAPVVTVGPDVTICLGDSATITGSGSGVLQWITYYNILDTNSATTLAWPTHDTAYCLQVGTLPLCKKDTCMNVFVSSITASDTAVNLCFGQVVNFSSTILTDIHGTTGTYAWTFGDGSPGANGATATHQYGSFGSYNYTLIVSNSTGCLDTVLNTVNISDKPHASMSVPDTSVCLGQSVTVTNTSTPGTTAALESFTIDMQPDGITDATSSPFTFTYSGTGDSTIYLIEMDSSQCLDTATQVIVIHPLPIASFTSDTSCISVATNFTGTSTIAAGGGSIASYQWTVNGTVQPQDSVNISYTFMTPGTDIVCLQVTDIYGCTADSCEPVDVVSSPLATVTPQDSTICVGYSASFLVAGPLFDRVSWSPTTWINNPTDTLVTITPAQTMSYLVYIYYRTCNPIVDTVNVFVIDSVPVSASADPTNIVLGLSSNVTSTVKGSVDSIIWGPDSTLNCRNCFNPIATPHETTTYTATVYYTLNGVTCTNTATVTITVITSCDRSLIYVPNTFSPNNDGNNDVFRLRGQGITKVNYFRIYDRWGKLVYEATNADSPDQAAWNGCVNNDLDKPETSGVFVYLFEITCVTGQTVTGSGNVTLLR